jgi:hypothetical protein
VKFAIVGWNFLFDFKNIGQFLRISAARVIGLSKTAPVKEGAA